MGASAGFALLLSLVRVKFAAVLIGSTGVGLMATYNALVGAIVILLGMGVPAFAVREIALAYGSGQSEKLAAIVVAVKRLCWMLAILGLVVTFAISDQFSILMLGDKKYSKDLAFLSAVVLLAILNNAYAATIQGTRQVSDMAWANVLGAVGGALLTLFCFMSLGVDGVTWALLGVALAQICTTLFFARRLPLVVVKQSWRESATISWRLLWQGGPLMLSSFVATASNLIILTMIARDLNLASAGFYSAAAALAGVFFGLLNSMGSDYYPRLSAANQDPLLMGRIVNEQTEIGLLLTMPGLLLCCVLSPLLIELLYAKSFIPASPLLQWFLVGSFARVVSWPMGFVLIAIGRSKIFLFAEIVLQTIQIIFVWFAVQCSSLLLTAIAFCLVYIAYAVFMFWLCSKLIFFKWSDLVWRLLILNALQFLLGGIFLWLLGDVLGIFLSLALVIFSALISMRYLVRIIGFDNIYVQKILRLPCMKKWVKYL